MIKRIEEKKAEKKKRNSKYKLVSEPLLDRIIVNGKYFCTLCISRKSNPIKQVNTFLYLLFLHEFSIVDTHAQHYCNAKIVDLGKTNGQGWEDSKCEGCNFVFNERFSILFKVSSQFVRGSVIKRQLFYTANERQNLENEILISAYVRDHFFVHRTQIWNLLHNYKVNEST